MNRIWLTGAATLLLALAGGCATLAPMSGGAAERPLSDVTPTSAADTRAKIHVDLGKAYIEIGRYDVALDEAKVALQDSPGYPPAYHLQGLVYMFINDIPVARQNFEQALRAAPNDPEFNNSYGWFQCVNGQPQDGLARLASAGRNPYYRHQTRAYTNAGLCYLRLQDDANAEEQFLRAVSVDENNAQALFHLGAIAYRRGDYAAARTFLVQLHQRREPTAESVWLGVRTERKLGNRDNEASYAAQLRGRFADSSEYQSMTQGNYE